MIQSILSILIALGVLITFHEFGHYWVARRCGVKVLRFSVGFGKPIYTYYGKTGTEYTLALIPLGGYVKMLDSREGEIPEALKSQAFNYKTVWQRIAIVAAGPVANFILAVFLYAVVGMLGVQHLAPKMGSIQENSPAAQTSMSKHDEIVQIDGRSVESWEDINFVLADLIGKSGQFQIRYIPDGSNVPEATSFTLDRWLANKEPNNLIEEFGVTPWVPAIAPIIDQVFDGGAAMSAGFMHGDTVHSINGELVSDWRSFVKWVQSNPNRPLEVEVERGANIFSLTLVPEEKEVNGKRVGIAGISVKSVEYDPSLIRETKYGFFSSFAYGLQQTWTMVSLTVSSIGKMLQGLISIDNLSGPITIAKVASASADSGLQSFLKFMAYLSVSLGVLNLLPIPMLDGGHLLFFSIEALRKKPVSERVQGFAYRIGASLLFALMAVAMFNDLARL
ncbi:RIP metalloprotease RseP [Marinomonas mediterranea]|uniref:RIP metalloprotease RseP n=1 Tax=Marinomonas mediterranea TaxID=119864 RepID=UPI0023495868|nr:RIP metalloprotease RseP [Marinomonas mediterranea]WCN12535.1 RIP metalloprotease RseP [Marinomonas mediterranea]